VVKDYTQTVMLPGHTPLPALQNRLQPLLDRARSDLHTEGLPDRDISLHPSLDVRYRGQSFDLNVPFSPNWQQAFETRHRQTYGYHLPEGETEIVNLRVRAVGRLPTPRIPPAPIGDRDPAPARLGRRAVWLGHHPEQVPFYDGERLTPGNHIPGPALILLPDTTILLGPHDHARLDAYYNLLIDVGRGGE